MYAYKKAFAHEGLVFLASGTLAGPGGFCLGHTPVPRAGLTWCLPTDLNHALSGTDGCHPKEVGVVTPLSTHNSLASTLAPPPGEDWGK